MSEEKVQKVAFKLSDQIVGTTDLRRVTRELEKIDDFIYQSNIRTPGTPVDRPRTTKILESLFELNGLSILEDSSRKSMLRVLKRLDEKAPVIHISFATEPSYGFMQKIVVWVRKNINPYLMVNTGLQPSIIVGCNVRTTNKVFDMSLRNRFVASKPIIIEKIKKMAEVANG